MERWFFQTWSAWNHELLASPSSPFVPAAEPLTRLARLACPASSWRFPPGPRAISVARNMSKLGKTKQTLRSTQNILFVLRVESEVTCKDVREWMKVKSLQVLTLMTQKRNRCKSSFFLTQQTSITDKTQKISRKYCVTSITWTCRLPCQATCLQYRNSGTTIGTCFSTAKKICDRPRFSRRCLPAHRRFRARRVWTAIWSHVSM